MERILSGLNGPNEMGRHWGFWLGFLAVIAAGAAAPDYLSRYELLNVSNFLTNVFLALGLCVMWGFCGILSLGQGAFLGLGGYAYGIAGINFIESHGHTWAALGHRARRAGGGRGPARLHHVLREAQGRLRGDPDAGRDAPAGDVSEPDRGPGLVHRRRSPWRKQRPRALLRRHPRAAGARLRLRRRHRVQRPHAGILLPHLRPRGGRLSRAALARELQGRPGDDRDPRGRRAHRGAGLRHPPDPARRVLPGRLSRRALRHPLRLVGEFHHAHGLRRAEQHLAGDLGRRRRAQEPDGHGDRHAGPGLALAEARRARQLCAGGAGRAPDPGHDAAAGRRDYRRGRALPGAQAAARAGGLRHDDWRRGRRPGRRRRPGRGRRPPAPDRGARQGLRRGPRGGRRRLRAGARRAPLHHRPQRRRPRAPSSSSCSAASSRTRAPSPFAGAT